MTPPNETDDESTRSAYWQGVVTTKLDNLTSAVEALIADKTKVHENHEARLVSLESWRGNQKAFLLGVGLGSGLLSGGVVAAATQLIT